ncbi:MAG: DUF4136 domain-containing protein [Mediterranea massiliensis]|nr:DUF4136 domain-containing protein [Mediterranea massiliensis]
MKKIIPLLAVACIFAACEKEPDMGKLDDKYLVYTNHDTSADFKSFNTFYLPDSILVIGESRTAVFWKDSNAEAILDAYAKNMQQRGYIRVNDREEADLGLQVSYIESTYYFTDYGQPQWWWNYPGYWDSLYWGDWGDWYYPYAVTYTYSTGAFLTELVNLDAPQGASAKLPVLWTSYLTGLLSSSNEINDRLAIEAVNQSFSQSSYLSK